MILFRAYHEFVDFRTAMGAGGFCCFCPDYFSENLETTLYQLEDEFAITRQKYMIPSPIPTLRLSAAQEGECCPKPSTLKPKA